MRGSEEYSDGWPGWISKGTKVLGTLQFILGLAVICTDLLAFFYTNLPIFAGVSTAFVFLAAGALAVASAIYTSSYLLMVSLIFNPYSLYRENIRILNYVTPMLDHLTDVQVSSLFASFISSVSGTILVVHASVLLFSHTSPICGLSSSCMGRTMHEVHDVIERD